MWFQIDQPAPGVRVATEPRVNPMFRAAMVRVQGRDADLQFDFGCGIRPLRKVLDPRDRPVIAVASHAHVDHIGGFHEFSDRRGHPAEAAGFAGFPGTETFAKEFRTWPGGAASGADLSDWRLRPAPLTATLDDGDRIDLGDRAFTVLHLPGHSPGGLGLLDEVSGLFLSGDAIYDDEILDDIPGADLDDYRRTMNRLRHLDCRLVIGGHGPVMTRTRMVHLAEDWLRRRG
jgi:glyoxylase-like metal-dependent hydrolase (beta-lactamase superfamily II)